VYILIFYYFITIPSAGLAGSSIGHTFQVNKLLMSSQIKQQG